MEKFPKKYNHKNIKCIKKESGNNPRYLYSGLIPLNQKINPGCIFSIYYNDMYCRIQNILGNPIIQKTGYNFSSAYYSRICKKKENSKNYLQKEITNNFLFLGKAGINADFLEGNCIFSEDFNRYIRKIFVNLYSNHKISNSEQVVYWNEKMHTSCLKSNIIEKDVEVQHFILKYFIESKGSVINVNTTRIETIFGDVAIAVNPIDKRYKKLVGQNVIIPIINRSIPIIADESVNMCSGDGTMRITPAHDQLGLEIAKKHGLPTNVYAIDTEGYFTENAGEFSGKSVKEFLENIIKYVEDIGNMESIFTIKEKRYFDGYTHEELYPFGLTQWNIDYNYTKDFLSDFINSDNFSFNNSNDKGLLNDFLDKKYENTISNKSKGCLSIPIVSNVKDNSNKKGISYFAINDDIIFDIYKKNKSKKDIAFTMIISNLILDGLLQTTFNIQNLIEVLFSKCLFGNITKIEKYIEIYEKEYGNDQELRGLEKIKKLISHIDDDVESIDDIVDLLKSSFAIQIDNENISINCYDIFGIGGLSFQDEDCFNKDYIDSCQLLYSEGYEQSLESFNNISKDNGIFSGTEQEIQRFLSNMLLSIEYSRRIPYSNFITHEYLVDFKGQKINNYNSKFLNKDFYENLNLYGADALRLTLLLGDSHKKEGIVFDTYKANYYRNLLNKFWNANRYIYSKLNGIVSGDNIDLDEIFNSVNGDINDYDIWMLHSLKTILDDFYYQSTENNFLSLGKKLINSYINDFCDKYINITKILNNKDTNKCLVFIGLIFLDLLYPFIPNFVSDIKSKFNVLGSENVGLTINTLKDITLKDRNYKINIFMNIIDKTNKLKESIGSKKHELIDIVLQANPDFLSFFHENEIIFRSLVKVNNIDVFALHEIIPEGYITDNVINISLGVKKIESATINVGKDMLKIIQEEYNEKNEQLQHLKTVLASVYASCDPDTIQKKKQEISELQAELENMEFEMSKLKING